jgi:dTDP-4-dehydrorhamnose reductase
MKILVLGASGMLGNAMMRVLGDTENLEVFGTIRAASAKFFFPENLAKRLIADCDVENSDSLNAVFVKVKPDIVINCIGLIKQLEQSSDPLKGILVNALLPHRLHKLCSLTRARLVHFSTDCVFNGSVGNYTESSAPDASDLYGKSKFLGEVGGDNAITIRTSIIGHELQSAYSLLGWFFAQQVQCKGYTRAIFSGLPTTAMAGIVRDYVIPNPKLSGLYHVAAEPISKYELLKIVADVYEKPIDIIPDDSLVIDRSLNAERFTVATGYRAPSWPILIQAMRHNKLPEDSPTLPLS